MFHFIDILVFFRAHNQAQCNSFSVFSLCNGANYLILKWFRAHKKNGLHNWHNMHWKITVIFSDFLVRFSFENYKEKITNIYLRLYQVHCSVVLLSWAFFIAIFRRIFSFLYSMYRVEFVVTKMLFGAYQTCV